MRMSISSLLTLCGIDELLRAIDFLLEMWIPKRAIDDDVDRTLEVYFHLLFEIHELFKDARVAFAFEFDQQVDVAFFGRLAGRKGTKHMQALHAEGFAGFL